MLARDFAGADERIGLAVYRYLHSVLSEERTDAWAGVVASMPGLPRWWPRWVVRSLLDRLFPGPLLWALGQFLMRIGAVTPLDVARANNVAATSPFRSSP